MPQFGDGLTNVHCVEGVLFVQWTTFRAPTQGETSIHDGSSLDLDRVINDLRHVGQLGFHEPDHALLWYFVLSGPNIARDSQLQAKATIVSDVISTNGLAKFSSGSLRASDLPESLYDPRELTDRRWPDAYKSTAATSQDEGAEPPSPTNSIVPDNTRIYCALQSAIVGSIEHWLLETEQWMRLTPKTLLHGKLSKEEDDPPCREPKVYAQSGIEIKTQWLPNGTIIVLIYHRNDFSPTALLPDANYAILAPLGVRAEIIHNSGRASKVFSSRNRRIVAWGNFIDQWMRSQGVILTRPNEWIHVRIHEARSSPDDEGITIAWPLELCYTTAQYRTRGRSKQIGSDEDPLGEAEEWLTKSDELQIQIAEQLSWIKRESSLRGAISYDDAMLRLLKRNENALDAQAVMGIYPTPPDGARSQNHMTHDDAGHRPTEDRELGSHVPTELGNEASGIKVSIQDYDNLDDDELFGHGGGIYQDNGITEDDFSFFDEPDQTPRDIPEHSSSMQPSPSETIQAAPMQETRDQAERHVQEGYGLQDQDIVMEGGQSIQLSDQAMVDASSYSESLEKDTTRDAESLVVPGSADKYGLQGKFAFHLSQPPTTVRPSRSPERDQLIPRLRSAYEETSPASPDSASENGESSPSREAGDDDTTDQESDSTLRSLGLSYNRDPQDLFNRLSQQACDRLKSSPPTTSPHSFTEKTKSLVRLGQLVADQAFRYQNCFAVTCNDNTGAKAVASASEVVKVVLPTSSQCRLDQCTRLANLLKPAVPQKVEQPTSRKRDLRAGNSDITEQEFKLATPQFRAKRGSRVLDLSLYALRFWEELGLSPYRGQKDVSAFLICPDLEAFDRGGAAFLEAIGSTYTSLRLGLHSTGHTSVKGYSTGVVSVPRGNVHSNEVYDKFGRALQAIASQDSTIVVYMVNQSSDFPELKRLCARFLRISDAANLRPSSTPSNIVLKVVPGSIIGSSSFIAIPTVSELINISKDVYDRSPSEIASDSPYASLALVELTPALPDGVDFKLSRGNPTILLQQESVAHIAYCWEEASSWLTVALTDTLGCHSWSASFYTDVSSEQTTIFRAVVREVLDVAREALGEAHGNPKIIVTSDRPVHSSELEVWTSTAHAQELALAFIRLDDSPPLQLVSNLESVVETPIRPSVIGPTDLSSPDSNTPRAAEETDAAARLIDPVEEVTAVVATSLLDLSQEHIDLPPSLGSGYLVKSQSVTTGLSIVAAENYDLDIRSLLKMNHDLTCLSKARSSNPNLPWHVAFARQAQKGLLAAGL